MEPEIEGKEREVEKFAEEMGIRAELIRFSKPVRTVADVQKIGIDPSSVVKTLIVKAGGKYHTVLIRGDARLNEQKLARVLGVESVKLVNPKELLKLTGVPVGAVSPLLPFVKMTQIIVDKRVYELDEAYAGGGSVKTLVAFSPREYVERLKALVADIST